MTLRQLEIFSAIIETGRFTAAARKLYVAQPSVSQQIRALEEELGEPLFIRLRNRKLHLTEAGKILKGHADLMLRESQIAQMEIASLSREPVGQIHIGVGGHQLTSMLPPALSAFRSKFTKVSVDIFNGTTPQIAQMLRTNHLDLGIVNFPVDIPELRTELLFTEELVVAVRPSDPLSRKRRIEPDQIAQLPLVLYDRSTSTRQRLDKFFRQHDITPNVVIELSSVEAMKSMVAGGLGAAIVPASALLNSELRGATIKGRPLAASVGVAMPMLPRLPKVLDSILELIKTRFREIKSEAGR